MGFFGKIFDKKIDDYSIQELEKATKKKKPGYILTDEDRELAQRSRTSKSYMKRLKDELEIKRIERMMKSEEFEDAISQEERIERLKSLKIDNMPETDNSSDAMLMHLLTMIQNKQAPQQPQQPQQPGFQNMQPGYEQMQEPVIQQPAEQPQSRFSDEQMKELISKLPTQVVQTIKNLEEEEMLQAYDIIKGVPTQQQNG